MSKVKDFPIEWFGSKLMIAGKSIFNLPDKFLSYARNARIYDGGIWPRKGKQLLTNSVLWTNNKGGFMMNGKLFQIANSKIYEVNMSTGVQTEKATLGYDAMTDVIVYGKNIAVITSQWKEMQVFDWSTVSVVQTEPWKNVGNVTITIATPAVVTLTSHGLVANDPIYFSTSGALPTGITAWQKYYVLSTGLTANDFEISLTKWGAAINTSWTQSGVQSVLKCDSSGMIEYCRWFTFTAVDNILYNSRPINSEYPQNAYDFTKSGNQVVAWETVLAKPWSITFNTSIKGLFGTMNWLYVFTEETVEFLGANALQNVSGSATFISTPIGKSMYPISNLAITGSGDKIFYITKSLQVQTINYTPGVTVAELGELSARPVVGIKEFLNTISLTQPNAFAHYNENDKTIQFNIRSLESGFNDYVLVYDLVNDTWNVDTGKNYNYVVKNGYDYYGFSDVNSSVYVDDTGYSDAGSAIEFRIKTNNLIQGTILQKKYRGFYTAGGIGGQTDLIYIVNIDNSSVFQDTIYGAWLIPDVGETGGSAIGDWPVGGDLFYLPKLNPFERGTNEGRIFQDGKRIQIEIYSQSQIQDFIIDRIGILAEYTGFQDINDTW